MRFDALVAASGKCLEGVPGMGFVFLRKAIARRAAPATASRWRWTCTTSTSYMEKTGQWRFTPPTHVVVALAEAVAQFVEEGGQPARLARYTDNCKTLVDGMRALGFKPFLRPEIQAPIIVTFHAPADPAYDFKRFYAAAKARGFILYPGKLTQLETFRVGCIGAIGRNEMQQAVQRGGRLRCARWASPTAHRRCSTHHNAMATQKNIRPSPPCASRARSKVKVAVSDIDGILRGKYLHNDKFYGAVSRTEGGFGFCDVVFGWDSQDQCYDNTQVTGWQHGFPDALARLDLDTARHVPWDGDVPFFLGEFVNADGSAVPGVPAPDA